MNDDDKLVILKQLERGEISAEQAEERFRASPEIERDYHPRAEGAPDWIQRLWVYPLVAGLVIVGAGAWIIAATAHANVLWFVCGLPLVLFGSFVLALAAATTAGHWLYVDIQGRGPHHHNMRFGVPFPLGLVRGALWLALRLGAHPRARFRVRGRTVGFNASWAEADAFLTELERELTQGNGVTVNVEDRDERVQVYLV